MSPYQVTPDLIAHLMQISTAHLWHIVKHSSKMYWPAKSERIKGKCRTFHVPKQPFMYKLRLLHEWFMVQDFFHSRAYCGVRGKSYLKHADEHLGKRYLWNVDIEKCFPSITTNQLKMAFLKRGFRSDVSELFSQLMTIDNQVPQGSPISGDAMNIMLYQLDSHLNEFSSNHSLTSGRYADDIVVSGNSQLAGDLAIITIENQLSEIGLRVNLDKKARNGFQSGASLQLVHNQVVNNQHGIQIHPEKRSEYFTFAESYVASCRSAQLSNLESIHKKRVRLRSMISIAKQLRCSHFKHLKSRLRIGDQCMVQRYRDRFRWPLPDSKKIRASIIGRYMSSKENESGHAVSPM